MQEGKSRERKRGREGEGNNKKKEEREGGRNEGSKEERKKIKIIEK